MGTIQATRITHLKKTVINEMAKTKINLENAVDANCVFQVYNALILYLAYFQKFT